MFEIRSDGFYLDNEKFLVHSGACHYFRIPEEYWEDRLYRIKAMGLNTVETYVCWNMHEKKQGEFDFSGMLDIEQYVRLAAKLGLYVIIRPGPYICAEWDNGGLPHWLAATGAKFRRSDPVYLNYVARFFSQLLPRLAPYQTTNGGNILMFQLENEYGSYGNDKNYLLALQGMIRENGIDAPLFTSDGGTDFMLSGGTLPDVFKTVNFGSDPSRNFGALIRHQQDMPLMCSEFWCGWFDAWGGKHHTRSGDEIVECVDYFLSNDINFNIYVAHGGTNFGFTAGANHADAYAPTVTSYDYGTLISEHGEITSAYLAVRDMLIERADAPELELPPVIRTQNLGKFKFTKTARLLDNTAALGPTVGSPSPLSFEELDLMGGMARYTTVVKGKYEAAKLKLESVHDVAQVYINGEYADSFDRVRSRRGGESLEIQLKAFDGELKIDVLVAAYGRVNYGTRMPDRKGLGRVFLGSQELMGWECVPMSFEDLSGVEFKEKEKIKRECVIAKLLFECANKVDCFIDTSDLGSGFIIVNGHNLGRYCSEGPQQTLYMPGCWLEKENELICVEYGGAAPNYIKIVETPRLG
ncbi:MAG: beta-galactosidase [Clostridia bacterium]|nr:beta-galactosidase [Clostridia bacterium]